MRCARKRRGRAQEQWARRLEGVEACDTWEDFSFEELERGAATGGDMRHTRVEVGLVDSSHGVPASDDSDAALVGHLSQGLGHTEGALGAVSYTHLTLPTKA